MSPEHSGRLAACRSGRNNIVDQQNAPSINNMPVADTERVLLVVETSLYGNTFLWTRVSSASQDMFVSPHAKRFRQYFCNNAGGIKPTTQAHLPALGNRDHQVGVVVT